MSMEVRGFLALLFLMSALAGCTGAADGSIDEQGSSVITNPTDYSYVGTGTDGSGWHVHDYWRGQESQTILDATQDHSGSFITYGGTNGGPLGTFRPDAGIVVPQGAAWIHAQADWSMDEDQSDYGHMELWVRTANETAYWSVGRLEPGQVLNFTSNNDLNDPPHQQLSFWRFQIRAMPTPGASEVTFVDSRVELKIEAVRGLEIPAWPPHPDFWQGQSSILLAMDSRDVRQVFIPLFGFCSECLGRHSPAAGSIVPYDASRVEVLIETGTTGLDNLVLEYSGADTWDFTRIEPEKPAPGVLSFSIPVNPQTGDSPYAKNSLWEFQIVQDMPPGTSVWYGTYQITITAHRDG